MVRLTAAVLVAVAFLLAPAALPAAAAQTPTTLELTLERPVWQLREQLVVTGRLTTPDGPLGGASIRVGVNGDQDDSPYATTTAPDGTYRLQFWVEDWWGFGGNSLTARFPGDEHHAVSDATTIFQVAPDTVAPVRLTVDPLPTGPVSPDQQVALTGTLRNDRDEPAEGHSVFAVVDAQTDHRVFGTVDGQGRWLIDLRVPTRPGEWSKHFPAYRVPVVFEGDWWLAPAQDEITLTLAEAPAGAAPTTAPSVGGTPSPSPVASPSPSLAASLSASPTVSVTAAAARAADRRAGAPSWLPIWLPAWVASPAFLVAAGGVLSLVAGAALVSHARGG